MNTLLQSFASAEWTYVVEGLLHTLWLGALIAGGLYLVLRGKTDPMSRHRWCVGALLGVMLCGIIAWAVLPRPSEVRHPVVTAVLTSEDVVQVGATKPNPIAPIIHPASPSPTPESDEPPGTWTPWLALVWLIGVAAMLARAGSAVADAEKLRRSSRPLENEAILKLIEEARQKLGLARRIRVIVTERLTSPAVMGLVTPVLILPLSLVTAMPVEQLQLIVLHELAHIRRGDYFINLCQMLVESLLFFNPAVWWISRQIRQEREACCDAIAIELAGERLQYAQTLAQVAGSVLEAAPAFGDQRNPSGLKDRIQRLLVPGYRPALRLTWFALAAALFAGGGLLFLSALGTRITVAAIVSPQERVARIEKKLNEIGEGPATPNYANDPNPPQVKVSGTIRTWDGSPVPKWIQVSLNSSMPRSSYGTAVIAKDGKFSESIRAGNIVFMVDQTNFAPTLIGPFNGFTNKEIKDVEAVLQPGFDVPVKAVDADSGKVLTDATIVGAFVIQNQWFQSRAANTAADGSFFFSHCVDSTFNVTVRASGHQITVKKFDHIHASEMLQVEMRGGSMVAGTIVDKTSGQPIEGATLRLRYQSGAEPAGPYDWQNPLYLLGKSDSRGAFRLNEMTPGSRCFVGISAPGHELLILTNVFAGQTNLTVRLGPELIVRGHVLGSLKGLMVMDGAPELYLRYSEQFEDNSYGNGEQVKLHVTNGVATFRFTNHFAGHVDLGGVERDVTGPIDDWVVDLDAAKQLTQVNNRPKREVIFRFKDAHGGKPSGTVAVSIPDNLDPNHLTAHDLELAITNGEVRAQIPIGGKTSLEARHMAGYWFNRWGKNGDFGLFSISVTNGVGPMVIEVPLIPAGAIYGKALNPDGGIAGEVMFGVNELVRAPGREDSTPLDSVGDSFSGNAPRNWVSNPLPLGGTYQVYAWHGNQFTVSKPIKLTDAKPDAEVTLQLTAGKTLSATVLTPDGKPLSNAGVKILFMLAGKNGFDLKPVVTDAKGRFRVENTTPEFGDYSAQVVAPGMMAESVKLRPDSEQTITLKGGRILGGRVLEQGTGRPIPGARVQAFGGMGVAVPAVLTDASGYFQFDSLDTSDYMIFVEGSQPTTSKFHANGKTNVEFNIKLYAGSKLKPVTP